MKKQIHLQNIIGKQNKLINFTIKVPSRSQNIVHNFLVNIINRKQLFINVSITILTWKYVKINKLTRIAHDFFGQIKASNKKKINFLLNKLKYVVIRKICNYMH